MDFKVTTSSQPGCGSRCPLHCSRGRRGHAPQGAWSRFMLYGLLDTSKTWKGTWLSHQVQQLYIFTATHELEIT